MVGSWFIWLCFLNLIVSWNSNYEWWIGKEYDVYKSFSCIDWEMSSSSSGIFVWLWKALAGKNSILLKLQNTKFCACMFAHCACGQLFLLLAYAVFSHQALLTFTHHQMFLHHRVWNPELSFSRVLMFAIFPCIVLFPIVQQCEYKEQLYFLVTTYTGWFRRNLHYFGKW